MKDTVFLHRLLQGMEYTYSYTLGNLVSSASQVVPTLLFIPVCELLIYPLVQNFIPTILKRIGVGMAMAVATNVATLVLYVDLDVLNGATGMHSCFLLKAIPFVNASVPASVVAVPIAIGTFSEVLVYIAG